MHHVSNICMSQMVEEPMEVEIWALGSGWGESRGCQIDCWGSEEVMQAERRVNGEERVEHCELVDDWDEAWYCELVGDWDEA